MTASLLKSLRVPRFKLPSFVAAVGQRLPQWPHAPGLAAFLRDAMAIWAEQNLTD